MTTLAKLINKVAETDVRAAHYMLEYAADKPFLDHVKSIDDFFTWADQPQGVDYWSSLHKIVGYVYPEEDSDNV